MKKQNVRRVLAAGMASLVMLQAGPAVSASAAWNWGNWNSWGQSSSAETAVSTLTDAASVQLQSGIAIIPAGADAATVKQALFDALVVNKDGIDPMSLNWEYYCTGKNGLLTNDAWGSINGFTSEKKVVFVTTTYTHPALSANADGNYQVRIAGTTIEVTLTKAKKLSSSITLNEGVSIALPYTADAAVDYTTLEQAIFDDVVASTTPELTVNDVTIEYYAEATSGSIGDLGKNWAPLSGGEVKDSFGVPYSFPGMTAGDNQKIRISYAGTDSYSGTSVETTVNITERSEAPYQLNAAPYTVAIPVDENMNNDYDALSDAIFKAVIASSDVLTADNVTVEYYYKGITDLDSKWLPLEGKSVVGGMGYPAISAGEQKIRISWAGSQQYAPTTIEATITVADREQVVFTLNDEPYTVGMKFAEGESYDYDETAAAIFEAVVASTSPIELTADDVTIEYNTDKNGVISNFKPLEESILGGLWGFDLGEWQIRISWAGNQQYRGNSVIVWVNFEDSRASSTVALNEGVSFTYNMDASVMKQAIFDNVIDWTNSELPAKETLTPDDFTYEYYGEEILFEGGIDSGIKSWVPIEGKSYDVGDLNLGKYPQMGAGEQQLRVSFNGNADYRPSSEAQGNVTVNKAKVTVKVNSTNIYVDEKFPADYITTDPADEFDIYVVHAGLTSSVTAGIYIELPDRFSNSAFLKVLDPVVELISGKTFTQMLNEGVTVGELRKLFSTQELLDILDKLNIDTGTFGEILNAINKMPSIMDSVRISFGAPSRAGLYTSTVITDNPNYETGVGVGMVLVKMRLTGNKLTWNQEISGGKLTAEEAQNFDFGATLSRDGDVTIPQDNVHYLYSGFTSKWRVYSSTTTPPTEPGSYVVTVCIIGGDYYANPITRTFKITK